MRILYATDGSAGALNGGRFLAKLTHRRDVHVHIITVLANRGARCEAAGDPRNGAAILAAARDAVGAFPGHITTAMTRADSTSETVESILFSAAYMKADLIVLGATGHSAIARFLIGSVSEAVVRDADVPVLLARRVDGPLHEVIVGIDASDPARDAACWVARTMPLPAGCALHLVRSVAPPVWVWETPQSGSGLTVLETEGAVARAIRDEIIVARANMEPLARDLTRSAPVPRPVTTEVSAGNPAEALVRTARDRGAGLLVVGSQGRGGIGRFLIGSVSENVVRHANCSVLVVRQNCFDRMSLPAAIEYQAKGQSRGSRRCI